MARVAAAMVLSAACAMGKKEAWRANEATWAPCLNISEDVPGDVDASNNRTCYQDILWAKTEGVLTHPTWYPSLTVNSSIYEFQTAIFAKKGNKTDGTSWSCPRPCTWTPPVVQSEEQGSGSMGSMTSWMWALLLLACCCLMPCLFVLCACFFCYETVSCLFGGKDEKPKKSKRAIKVPAPVAAPEPAPAMAPVATTAAPMPVYQPVTTATRAASVVTTAPPVYMQAAPAPAPVSYAAPAAMTYSAPAAMTYAAPVMPAVAPGQYFTGGSVAMQPGSVSMAQPMAYAAAGPVSLFDQLDVNHDGSISRAEFATAMR